MNFFEHQDQARRNTVYLVILFLLAIAIMIVAIYIVALIVLWHTFDARSHWWQAELFLLISLSTLGIIGFGSLTKTLELRQGGISVAAALEGQELSPQTNDAKELQLLNVVSEMALASGTPIPSIYLLPREPGINAFAAGYTPDDTVIGITQGCLEQLSRDELQGVIAHEFSHILNGDMRLNLRLIGILQGLLFIHILGRVVLRSGWESSIFDRRNDDQGGLPIVIVGALIASIGGVGLVFGRLIKSAVSRQREFLADASAVQFTRNPSGLAGALRRIGGFQAGSKVRTPRAEEASHLFFGQAVVLGMAGDWFATHPPLKERIRRIAGTRVTTLATPSATAETASLERGNGMGLHGGATTQASGSNNGVSPQTTPDAANTFVATVGTAPPMQLAKAHAFLQTLPAEIRSAMRSPDEARAFIYALLLSNESTVRSRQLAYLKPRINLEQVTQLAQQLQTLDRRQYLPLLDLSIPALRTITRQQCVELFKDVQMLVRADKQLSLFEYALQLILQKRLSPHFQKRLDRPQAVTQLSTIWKDCQILLAVLARVGHTSSKDALYALKSGLARLPGASKLDQPQVLPAVQLYDLGKSLKRLEAAVPKLKQAIVEAAAYTVLIDNDVTPKEAELLRTVVICLDCPVPPFLEPVPRSPATKAAPSKPPA